MTMIETAPPETEQTFEPPTEKHLVSKDQDLVAAYVNGTPVEALCGKVFVPTRDPSRYPMCERCKAIHEEIEQFILGPF